MDSYHSAPAHTHNHQPHTAPRMCKVRTVGAIRPCIYYYITNDDEWDVFGGKIGISTTSLWIISNHLHITLELFSTLYYNVTLLFFCHSFPLIPSHSTPTGPRMASLSVTSFSKPYCVLLHGRVSCSLVRRKTSVGYGRGSASFNRISLASS